MEMTREEHDRRHATQTHRMASNVITEPMRGCFVLYDELLAREFEAEENEEPFDICSQCILSGLVINAAINATARIAEDHREIFLDHIIEDLKTKVLRLVAENEVDEEGGGHA